jgi:hypothetical protein
MKLFTSASILLLSISLFSCIEYKEKMKLNDDGSGEISFAIGLSEEILSMGGNNKQFDDFNEEKIKREYENKKGITFVGSKSYAKDGNRWIEISLKFDSLEDLEKASDSTSTGMIGKITLTQNENGSWVFTRKISKSNSSEKEASDTVSNGMMKMMFSQYKWQYELTLPSKIINTNAKEEDVDTDKNIVKWVYSLASLSTDKTMTVTFERQKSSSITYVVIGAVLLIMLSFAALNLAKKKNKESA